MKVNNDSVILRFNLHGFERDDIEININDNEIIIAAQRDTEKKIEEVEFESYEKSSHNFSYSASLPPVKEDEAVIEFKHGILKITIPKD